MSLLELHLVSLVQAPFPKFNIAFDHSYFLSAKKKKLNDNETQNSPPMYIPCAIQYYNGNGDDVDNNEMFLNLYY